MISNRWRIVGIVAALLGVGLGATRFGLGLKPALLDAHVFAIHSAFFETRTLAIITNNISEELSGGLLLLGLMMIVFSKERSESSAIDRLRGRALFLALFINCCLLMVAMLFVYGFGFVPLLVANMFSLPLLYLVIFNFHMIRRQLRRVK